ncbi:MAG: hypothetical protein QOF45_1422 [Gaiellaceae bacterium]|nr:hypothetical protein [Gaiellaceae bacterium]
MTLRQETKHPKKIQLIGRQRLVEIVGERFYGSAVGFSEGDVAHRFGYYIVARNGKWWWGQYASIVAEEDLVPLLQLAWMEGTFREDFEIRAEPTFRG